MLEETLQEVQRIADIRNDSSHGAEIQNPERLGCHWDVLGMGCHCRWHLPLAAGGGRMVQPYRLRMVCAIVMWTFDTWSHRVPKKLRISWNILFGNCQLNKIS